MTGATSVAERALQRRTSSTVLILGGGFGGLTVATELRRRLAREHRIVLVDRRPSFYMGLAKLWVLSGHRAIEPGTRELAQLERKGIEVVQATVTGIRTGDTTVTTTAGDLTYDYLIIALGADLAPERIPGFAEAAHNLYDLEGVGRLRTAIERFDGGRLLLVIFATPFKCPPAPYEASLLIHDLLERRGVRGRTEVAFFTPEPQPLPVAGPVTGETVKRWLAEAKIGYRPKRKPTAVDPGEKIVIFEDGAREKYDLLVGVPPHRVSTVVEQSGLAGPAGWIPVDRQTLRLRDPGVFAIGDVAAVMTANHLLLPRAGIFAEQEGMVVAQNIAAEISGLPPTERFEGRGYCFMEVGGGKASLVEGEFFAEPQPTLTLPAPSVENFERKKEFERSRLQAWFA